MSVASIDDAVDEPACLDPGEPLVDLAGCVGKELPTGSVAKVRPITDADSATSELVVRQQVEAGREQRLDRGRERDAGREVRGRRPSAPSSLPERALVDEHRRELLDEERVALGGLGDLRERVRREARRRARRATSRSTASSLERAEPKLGGALDLGPVGMTLLELGAGRADEERAARRPVAEATWSSRSSSAGLRPVDVLEHRDERPLRPRGSRAACARPRRARRAGSARRTGRSRPQRARRRPSIAGEGADLAARGLGRVVLGDPGGVADDLDQRPEGDARGRTGGSGRAARARRARRSGPSAPRAGATSRCRRRR